MTRLPFLFIIMFFLNTNAFGQTVEGPSGIVHDSVSGLIIDVIRPAISHLPEAQRLRIQNTKILIKKGGPFPGPLAGIDDQSQRIILLPEVFIVMLMQMAEAEYYAMWSKLQYFPQWWVSYALWRTQVFGDVSSGPFYDGPPPKEPLSFAGLNKDEIQSFWQKTHHRQGASGLINAALINVLLHEFGHHALDLFYNSQSSTSEHAHAVEVAADEWAMEVFENLSNRFPQIKIQDRQNILGRIVSVSLIREMERWKKVSNLPINLTHPPYSNRVYTTLDKVNCGNNSTSLRKLLCDFAEQRARALRSETASITAYEQRASGGEGFASFQLGMINLEKGQFSDACNNFFDALGKTDRRVTQYAGWCLEKGHYKNGIDSFKQYKMAESLYQVSAKIGWADGKMGLKRLETSPQN